MSARHIPWLIAASILLATGIYFTLTPVAEGLQKGVISILEAGVSIAMLSALTASIILLVGIATHRLSNEK